MSLKEGCPEEAHWAKGANLEGRCSPPHMYHVSWCPLEPQALALSTARWALEPRWSRQLRLESPIRR